LPFGIQAGTVFQTLAVTAGSMLMVYMLFNYREPLGEMGNWGYIGVAIAELGNSAVLIIPTPAPAYTFAMGALLNPLIIGVVGGLSAMAGELVGYYLGVRGQTLAQRGRLYHRFQQLTLRFGGAALFTFAVLPVPFDFAGVWAGAARYPLVRFVSIVAVGKIIKVTAVATTGYYGVHWFLGG
jgi:membrane protein YqaA with SNARE-associated domain